MGDPAEDLKPPQLTLHQCLPMKGLVFEHHVDARSQSGHHIYVSGLYIKPATSHYMHRKRGGFTTSTRLFHMLMGLGQAVTWC